MAIESCSDALVKFEDPTEHGLNIDAAQYFSQKFKKNFLSLERQIISSWRTHKSFYEALGKIMLTTNDKSQAKDLATTMLKTLQSKTCS